MQIKNLSDDEIFAILSNLSQYEIDGLKLLKKVKKKCQCNTDRILQVQRKFSIKKIRGVISHTTIYDYGITHDDIRNSNLDDQNKFSVVE